MRRSRKSLLIDYRTVFGSEAGKAVLKDLEALSPMLRRPVAATDSIDPYRMALLRGRSDVILHIYQMINKDPYSERDEIAQGE